MKEIIKILNQVLFFGAIVYFILGLYGGVEQILSYEAWIVALTVCSYLMRQNISKLSAFLAGHFILAAVGIGMIKLVGFPEGFLAVLIVMIVISVVLRMWISCDFFEEPGYFHLAVFALCFLISSYMGSPAEVQNGILLTFFATLLLKIFYGNLNAADEFIRNRMASTKIDERKLKRLNTGITLAYTGALGVIMALTCLFRTDGISSMILGWFRGLLQFIFSGLSSVAPEEVAELETETKTMLPPLSKELPETPLFLTLFNIIFKVVAIVSIAACVIFIVVLVFRTIYRRFYAKPSQPEEAEDYVEPLTMRGKLPKRRRKGFFEVFERTPSKKIRRMYRKLFKAFQRGGNLEYLNPKEQLEALADKEGFTDEKREEILLLYEKARYSELKITEEEAKRMQELLRG